MLFTSKLRITIISSIIGILVAFAVLCYWRDTGYANIHHDEAISLMAAQALERDYAVRLTNGESPFHQITPAATWHAYTRDFPPRSFFDVRDDVMAEDIHPPLSFWMMNVWGRAVGRGGYRSSVVLTWLFVCATALLLSSMVRTLTGSSRLAWFGLMLFLCANSAVFTATWARQYGLLTLLFVATLFVAISIIRHDLSPKKFVLLSAAMGLLSVLGMLTHFCFLTMSAAVHATVIILVLKRSNWRRAGLLLGCYMGAGMGFFFILPGVLDKVFSRVEAAGAFQPMLALGRLPEMLIPLPSGTPVGFRALIGVILLLASFVACVWLIWKARAVKSHRLNAGGAGDITLQRLMPSFQLKDVGLILLAGMVGSGLIQAVLVAVGVFPGWATGPNHMCVLWTICVVALCILLSLYDKVKLVFGGLVLSMLFMVLVQAVYCRHLHAIKSHVNVSHVHSLDPDLVIISDLQRGMVLQLTEAIPENQAVLVSNAPEAVIPPAWLESGTRCILHLGMPGDEPSFLLTLSDFLEEHGYQANSLPVVHPGFYDATMYQP